jgi:Alpha-L-arabinofuranosidase B, catalytic
VLDEVSTAPVGAWWLEKLRTAYAGSCLKIQRADTTTLDIGFGSDGFVDEAAIAAFCGATDGFIHTLYDQTGNGRHLVQTTAASQHRIYVGTTGLLNRRNGKPVFTNDGTANGSRTLRTVPAVTLGLSGNAAITFGTRWRRIAGRNDCLPWGFGGSSSDESIYIFAVSTTQMRLALSEAGSATVTYNTSSPSFDTFQNGVIHRAASAAFDATSYRLDGTELTMSSSTGSATPNFISTSHPVWLRYRDVNAGTTDRIETAPGMVVWAANLGTTDLVTYESFMSGYT